MLVRIEGSGDGGEGGWNGEVGGEGVCAKECCGGEVYLGRCRFCCL